MPAGGKTEGHPKPEDRDKAHKKTKKPEPKQEDETTSDAEGGRDVNEESDKEEETRETKQPGKRKPDQPGEDRSSSPLERRKRPRPKGQPDLGIAITGHVPPPPWRKTKEPFTVFGDKAEEGKTENTTKERTRGRARREENTKKHLRTGKMEEAHA